NGTKADGAACQGGAIGTPFFLFTTGKLGEKPLFAEAFAPSDVQTLDASNETSTSATFPRSANPGGTSARVHFDFGATAAYGSSTTPDLPTVAAPPAAVHAPVSVVTTAPTSRYPALAPSDFA